MTKQKACKRKRIQQSGTLEYGEAADLIAPRLFMMVQPSKKAYSRDGQDRAQLALRRCGNCGGTGHNARTCQAAEGESSESDASTQYIFSDSSCSDNNDTVT